MGIPNFSFTHFRANPTNEDMPEIDGENANRIKSLKFSPDGEMLAFGDVAGRVSVLKSELGQYDPCVTFQSHESEFDCLKSQTIKEKISCLEWLKNGGRNSQNLLTANEKTIKLWRLTERNRGFTSDSWNLRNADGTPHSEAPTTLRLPQYEEIPHVVVATPKRTYANGHAFLINSVSASADAESFISADDLRINLWNYNVSNESFNIVDMKPNDMCNLKEVITSAEFHPVQGSVFAYASTTGAIRLCDMRERALCDRHSKLFDNGTDLWDGAGIPGHFVDQIVCAGQLKFSHNGRYVATRDVLTVKIWDINMESEPIKVLTVNEHLTSKLAEMYANESLFERFTLAWSPDDKNVCTGTMDGVFRAFGMCGGSLTIETTTQEWRQSIGTPRRRRKRDSRRQFVASNAIDLSPDLPIANPNYDRRAQYIDWHPRDNVLAVGCAEEVFFYENL